MKLIAAPIIAESIVKMMVSARMPSIVQIVVVAYKLKLTAQAYRNPVTAPVINPCFNVGVSLFENTNDKRKP